MEKNGKQKMFEEALAKMTPQLVLQEVPHLRIKNMHKPDYKRVEMGCPKLQSGLLKEIVQVEDVTPAHLA
eukprot:5068203-Karenia_brevis.AAC.1